MPYVVGMPGSLPYDAAIAFASAFYAALGYGKDVKAAFELGCAALALTQPATEETPSLLRSPGDPAALMSAPPGESFPKA